MKKNTDYKAFLKKLVEKADLPAHFDAVLVIDVQETFCNPDKQPMATDETQQVSEKMAALAPLFREKNIPLYSVYFASRDLPVEYIDFYNYQHTAQDTLIRKNTPSAFQSPQNGLIATLNSRNHKNLLLTGVYMNACVAATAKDAQSLGFNTWIAADCTASFNDASPVVRRPTIDTIKALQDRGIGFASTLQALNLAP
jgi:nicotinamidase-related amidase